MGDCELILTGAGASSRTALEAVGRTMAQAFPAYTVRLVCTTRTPGGELRQALDQAVQHKIRTLLLQPVLLTRGEEYDRIHGFELGVDDYVVKPFSPKELMLRAAAILRRAGDHEDLRETYTIDGITADFTSRQVFVDGVPVDMPPKEYDLFFYLVKNRNIALSREKLLSDVWGYDFYGDERTLDTHIKLLRKSLGPYSGRIVTLRGVGYRFEG